MKRNRTRRAANVALQTAELMMAAPQVVAHRVGRLAAAGHTPSARDRREFHRMGAEKVAAFQESWAAMGMHAWRQQAQFAQALMGLWTTWMRAAGNPMHPTALAAGAQALGRSASHLHHLALGVAGEGLAPVHRRAVANARRLSALTVPTAVAVPLTRRTPATRKRK